MRVLVGFVVGLLVLYGIIAFVQFDYLWGLEVPDWTNGQRFLLLCGGMIFGCIGGTVGENCR